MIPTGPQPWLCLAALALAAAGGGAQTIAPQDGEDGRHVWHTGTHRIEADDPIPPAHLRRLAKIAEATARAVADFPLPLSAPPPGRPRVIVFGDDERYRAAGGDPITAGMYQWKERRVILHGEHFLRRPTGTRLAPFPDESLLVHELVHLHMHGLQPKLPQWIAEGLCEYFAAAHQGDGVFRFDSIERDIRRHIRRRFDPADPRVALSACADLVGLDGPAWQAHLESLPPERRHHPYANALLMTHYLVHGGAERRARLREILAQPATRPAKARTIARLAEDLDGVGEKLARFWKSRGLTLEFASPTQNDPPTE